MSGHPEVMEATAPHRHDRPAATPPEPWLFSLHVGMGWPEEQPGGLNRMVAGLVRHLPDARVMAEALVAGSPAVERQSMGRARTFAQLSDPLPRRMLLAARAVRESVSRLTPDVVAVHFALFGFTARHAVRDTALVVHFHGPWAEESLVEGGSAAGGHVKHWIERRAYRRAHRFITLSDAFADVLERRYGIDRSLIRVVPGGVDIGRFNPAMSRAEARVAVGLPTDRPVVLTVRRLARRMGLRELVSAFATVRQRVPDALLAIVGGGALRPTLEAQIDGLGLTGSVRLLGRVEDAVLPTLFRAADLSVVPSSALEGFGLTSVDSLAAGTPPLVTPVGGLPEVVRGLSESLVLDDATAPSLAAGMIAALLGRVELPSPAACTTYATERFAWPAVARRTRAVYGEAIA